MYFQGGVTAFKAKSDLPKCVGCHAVGFLYNNLNYHLVFGNLIAIAAPSWNQSIEA